MLLPPELRDCVSPDHMVHFIMDTVVARQVQGTKPPLLREGLRDKSQYNFTDSESRII